MLSCRYSLLFPKPYSVTVLFSEEHLGVVNFYSKNGLSRVRLKYVNETNTRTHTNRGPMYLYHIYTMSCMCFYIPISTHAILFGLSQWFSQFFIFTLPLTLSRLVAVEDINLSVRIVVVNINDKSLESNQKCLYLNYILHARYSPSPYETVCEHDMIDKWTGTKTKRTKETEWNKDGRNGTHDCSICTTFICFF